MAAAPPHDYFDKNGTYLGNDKRVDEYYKGEGIRIVTKEGASSDEWFSNSVRFNEERLSEDAVVKIAKYYQTKYLNEPTIKVIAKTNIRIGLQTGNSDGSELFVRGNEVFAKDPAVIVGMSGYNRVQHMQNDKWFFINSLHHENIHVNSFSYDPSIKMYRAPNDMDGYGDDANFLHGLVYLQQVHHPSYSKMGSLTRIFANGYIKTDLLGAFSSTKTGQSYKRSLEYMFNKILKD